MKIQFIISLFLIFFACKSDEPPTPNSNPLDDGILKILFVGNSHTFYHDLPETVEQLIKTSGFTDGVEIFVSAPGGSTFEEHVMDASTTTRILIEAEDFDWVVLQENAFLAAKPVSVLQTTTIPFAKQMADLIKEKHEETQILLYLTHAYKEGSTDCSTNPAVCTYDLMQNEIRRNYIALESEIDAKIAPAGMVWKILRANEPMDLWDTDLVHPNQSGSYISAMTITTSILNEQIKFDQYVPDSIELSKRDLMITTVNQVVLDNSPDWRIF